LQKLASNYNVPALCRNGIGINNAKMHFHVCHIKQKPRYFQKIFKVFKQDVVTCNLNSTNMKTISLALAFACVTAVALAAELRAPVAKDLMITFANGGGPVSQHNSDSYQTSCCSASNAMYLYLAYDISALQGKAVSSAQLVFAPFLAATGAPRVVAPGGTQDFIEYSIRNTTAFRESPAYESYNDNLPQSDEVIGTLNVTVATKQQNNVIDITSAIRDSVAVGNTSFYISFGNEGGFGASITVAAREANALSSYIKITYEDSAESTCAPCPCGSTAGKRRSGCPVCKVCSTMAPTTEPPVEATCAPCPCGSTSGKRRSGCPVCKVCPTNAPSTAMPTTEPPVQQTPEPTCAPCPCGTASAKRRTGCPVCKVCPTNAPSTVAPSTMKPTTAAPSEPTAGVPATTKAPSTEATTTTKSPGENISGDNNARASGAATVTLSGLALIAAVVTLL
jgi:hypothetical protein